MIKNALRPKFLILVWLLIAFWSTDVNAMFIDELIRQDILRAAEQEEEDSNSPTGPGSMSSRQSFGSILGSPGNYTTVEGQYIFTTAVENLFPIVDLRVHRFSNNRYASNEGIALRYLLGGNKKVIGINFYHDWASTKSGSFNQVGVGLEWLASPISFKMNTYIPVGTTNAAAGAPIIYNQYIGGYVAVNQPSNASYRGVDFQIQGTFFKYAEMRAGLTGTTYYYKNSLKGGKNVFGGGLGLSIDVLSYINFTIGATHDGVFGTSVSGQVSVSVPIFTGTSSLPSSLAGSLLSQPVSRNEIQMKEKYCCWTTNW